jgi:hypothetical protein
MTHYESFPHNHLTFLQEAALSAICERFEVAYDPSHYHPTGILDGLPDGYFAGWVGGDEHSAFIERAPGVKATIYVGVSPEGHISS